MQFVFDDGATIHEIDVVLHDPDAVIADLVAALPGGGRAGRRLFVEGRELPADRRLDRAGITAGAVIRLDRDGGALGGEQTRPTWWST